MKINQQIDLTVEEANEILNYEPETGIISWRVTRGNNAKVGDEAGYLHPYGYRIIQIRGRNYLAHRIAWMLSNGSWPVLPMDHRDGVKDNNRIANIVLSSPVHNMRNRKLPDTNKSGKIGVSWAEDQKKWRAVIGVNRTNKHGGYFNHFEDAVKKRKELDLKYGFSTRHGSR